MKDLRYYNEPASWSDPEHIVLVEPEVSGGRISRDTISQIRARPDARAITISGLTQDTFEYFVGVYGDQFEAIRFWKCPLVSDLRPMERLSGVKYIVYYWNQRAERLWNLAKTSPLVGLAFNDFTRISKLDDICSSTTLEELDFGNRVWMKTRVDSLEPLRHCVSLRTLGFAAKEVTDRRIEPLAGIPRLKYLWFSPRLFATAQIAWLRSRLTADVESETLSAYLTRSPGTEVNGKRLDTVVVGERKPVLDSSRDGARIRRYADAFDEMVKWFTEHPEASPDQFER